MLTIFSTKCLVLNFLSTSFLCKRRQLDRASLIHKPDRLESLKLAKYLNFNHTEYNNKISSFPFHILSTINSCFNLQLLALCGDIELNPGPAGKLSIGTFNTSGCKKYSKLKRIMTWLFKHKKSDRFVFSLQETHISENEYMLVQSLWREGLIYSPSNGKARGVITLYSNNLFDSVLYTEGTPDGRVTVLIGNYNGYIDMFVALYSPNSGKNAEFYNSFFLKVNNLIYKFNVNNVYICGDFNLILSSGMSCNRTQTKYE